MGETRRTTDAAEIAADEVLEMDQNTERHLDLLSSWLVGEALRPGSRLNVDLFGDVCESVAQRPVAAERAAIVDCRAEPQLV